MKSVFIPLLISFFSFLLITKSLNGQQNFATNVAKVIADDNVIISYDLNSTGAKFYDVLVMITHKGKQIKATSMYGDFGSKIAPGNEKSIVWYFKTDFKENINEVQIDVFAYPMSDPKAIFEIVSFGNNKYAPCEITVVNKSANASEFRWDFGDPASGPLNLSTEKEPRHIYKQGGTYTISLVARNPLHNLENTFYQSFEIMQHPSTVANFEFEISGGKPPYEVKFKNNSENSDDFDWNFGDPGASDKNNTSKKPNPSYKYKQAGVYSVTLSAKSTASGLSDKIQKEVSIKPPEVPVAGFIFTLSTESAPAIAVFKNTSSNATNWQWNFGDPSSGAQNTSSDENPVHKYSTAGKFNVLLTATNQATGKSGKYASTISVAEPPAPPVAEFRIENNNQIGPVTVVFNNTSTNSQTFYWEFGDPNSGNNNTSTEESPTHTYLKPGRYIVVLKATNTKTNATNTYSENVNILEAVKTPVAGFKTDNYNATSPAVIKFTNTSANSNSYVWDFGDPSSGKNNSSTEPNPSHTYSKAGQYRVLLTATNTSTKAANKFSETITIAEPAKQPIARFEMDNSVITGAGIVSFINKSENSDFYEWNFGDPNSGSSNTSSEKSPFHSYNKPGRYNVVLKVTNTKTNTSNTFSEFVTVQEPVKTPVAGFRIENNNAISPAVIKFTNTSANSNSYVWDFGDTASGKSNSSTETNPAHTYSKAGQYRVLLTATNTSTKAINKFSETVNIVEPEKQPVAKFEMDNPVVTAPATVIFMNTSEDADSFEWNFGDEQSGTKNNSTEKNPRHTYTKPSLYKVVLNAISKKTGTNNVISKNVTVKEAEVNTEASFSFTMEEETAPVLVLMENNSVNADQFTWYFGDNKSKGNQSNERNPTHKYENEGTYTITLEAKNSKTGNKHSVSKEIVLSKKYPTYVKSTGKKGNDEVGAKVIMDSDGGFFVLIKEGESGSTIKKLDAEGSEVFQKNYKSNIQDFTFDSDKKSLIMAGILSASELFVQFADKKLNSAGTLLIHSNLTIPGAVFSSAYVSVSTKGEIGVAANLENSGTPVDIWFQKAEKNGQAIAPQVKAFRYIGKKTVRNIIPFDDGFMITGSWKEKESVPALMMTGFVDEKGKGTIDVMKSVENMCGCDVIAMPNGSISVLAAKEYDFSLSEFSLKNLDRYCTPLTCEINLPGRMKTADVHKFPPRVIANENGFIILGNNFNGTDNDIMLYWIDKTGTTLIRKQELRKEGDQFGTSFMQANDGSLIIVGTERVNNDLNALIIKTDPMGKVPELTNY